ACGRRTRSCARAYASLGLGDNRGVARAKESLHVAAKDEVGREAERRAVLPVVDHRRRPVRLDEGVPVPEPRERPADLLVDERARPVHFGDAASKSQAQAEVARLPLDFFAELDEPAALSADDALAR